MANTNKPNIFTTIKAISEVRPLVYDDIVEMGSPYEPFMVNRAFSLSKDTVLAASLMNERPFLENREQVAFYVNTLRPRNRFEAWPKMANDEEAEVIAKYYGMSRREARLFARLHTTEQFAAMRSVLEEGATPSRIR